MEDLGITHEEESVLDSAVGKLRSRCEELLKNIDSLQQSLPTDPSRSGEFARSWLNCAESIARQVHNIGQDAVPELEHFVFQPRSEPTERLPELLRTRLEVEQQQRDQKLSPTSASSADALQRRQADTQKSLKRISEDLLNSQHISTMQTKKNRVMKTYSPLSTTEKYDGTALLCLYKKNTRRGVKIEEIRDEDALF